MQQSIKDIIMVDPEIQFGKPVFKGTRVPVQSLFWHLEEGYSIADFLIEFPSVKRDQVETFLKLTANFFEKNPTIMLDEIVA